MRIDGLADRPCDDLRLNPAPRGRNDDTQRSIPSIRYRAGDPINTSLVIETFRYRLRGLDRVEGPLEFVGSDNDSQSEPPRMTAWTTT